MSGRKKHQEEGEDSSVLEVDLEKVEEDIFGMKLNDFSEKKVQENIDLLNIKVEIYTVATDMEATVNKLLL